jgi:hypothetical protein
MTAKTKTAAQNYADAAEVLATAQARAAEAHALADADAAERAKAAAEADEKGPPAPSPRSRQWTTPSCRATPPPRTRAMPAPSARAPSGAPAPTTPISASFPAGSSTAPRHRPRRPDRRERRISLFHGGEEDGSIGRAPP